MMQILSIFRLAAWAKINTPAHVSLFLNCAAAYLAGFACIVLAHAGDISSGISVQVSLGIPAA